MCERPDRKALSVSPNFPAGLCFFVDTSASSPKILKPYVRKHNAMEYIYETGLLLEDKIVRDLVDVELISEGAAKRNLFG